MRETDSRKCYLYLSGKVSEGGSSERSSCTFEEGKLYAVIGQSGSGKIHFIIYLGRPWKACPGQSAGRWEDISQIGYERHRRKNVSVIYQAFCLFPALTVLENVMYPMEITGKKKKEAREKGEKLLKNVGLAEETVPEISCYA